MTRNILNEIIVSSLSHDAVTVKWRFKDSIIAEIKTAELRQFFPYCTKAKNYEGKTTTGDY